MACLDSRLREQLAQSAEAAEHPALDRPERDAEAVGELGLGETPVVRELECLALLLRQPAQRVLHDLPALAQRGFLVGRLACDLVRLGERLRPATLLAADQVDRAAMDEREQPRARLRELRIEARGVA